MKNDQYWMQYAIELAKHGIGTTHPNPRVGAVIVDKNGAILGEGWHERAGQPHAEPCAIADARARQHSQLAEKFSEATIYVTLEPCASAGRTPACTQAIIDAGMGRVVYGSSDPNPRMAGGHQSLQNAGLVVLGGILCDQTDLLNRPFFHYQSTQLPYVIAKAAISLDGNLATHAHHSQWISGPASRHHAHQLRAESDAIMVGAGTLLHDNPSLNVRETPMIGDTPLRVVMALETPPFFHHCKLLSQDAPSRIYSCLGNENDQLWQDAGMELILVDDLHSALLHLASDGKLQILVEGGGALHAAMFEQRFATELVLYQAPLLIGGTHAIGLWQGEGAVHIDHALRLQHVERTMLGEDQLIRGRIIYPVDASSSVESSC
ncbi:MAG: bifunctional diaminohydroxyphosphoribosylaminopyrimidine deaminase/5-amino-6-(5-phosphoribosylamino)uracil reductase RibD [Zetaproteobacteria bacterium]|nr:bifunctional diaminohydroxyphosphoribosylaminopyrimidine deaminase/5-amino-6-(5-phosphoribosylamino)uracil reductase RibD [Zetaproteobacteria bacterium]